MNASFSLADVQGVLGLIALVISICSTVITIFATRNKGLETRFKTGSDRMDRHELRLQKLEQLVQSQPSREDMHKLELGLTRVVGSIERMEAVLDGNQKIMTRLETIVTRHEDHLLNKS